MTTETFTLPPADAGDDAVLMDTDLQLMMIDATASFHATGVLISLLRGDSPDYLDPQDRAGLALLLEGVHQRLELLVNALNEASAAFGAQSAAVPV